MKTFRPVSNFLKKSNFNKSFTLAQQYRYAHRFELKNCFKLYPSEKFEGKFPEPRDYIEFEKDELMQMYEMMSRIRRFELGSDSAYKMRHIQGFLHLYSGEEAVVVGVHHASHEKDLTITAYREHGHQLVKGDTSRNCMAELFGKYSGCAKGKGGSMHFYLTKKGFFGGNGIVGAQVPVGTGLAFALKYRKEPNVAWVSYGDGASNQGQVFEAYNMASLWKLPVIYICEDNRYGMGTATHRSSATTDYYKRGAPYIPGIWVDGMDVMAVKEAARYAREWALENGPIILHMATYRYYGHSMSDPGITYRTREEIKKMREESDPIKRLEERLISAGIATKEELKEIDRRMKEEIDDALKFAEEDEWPPMFELTTDVYAEKQYTVRGKHGEDIRVVQQ